MQQISFAVMALVYGTSAVRIYPAHPEGLVPQRKDD